VRRHLFACLLVVLLPAAAQAQSSQFGVRGLGLPGREQSARSMGSAGAFALFDGESGLSPAALAYLGLMTASFTGMSDYRTSETPAGSSSIRNFRFPQFLVGGPIKGLPISASFGFSNYMTRDFSFAFPGSVTFGGGPAIGLVDTLQSTGGINDLRLGLAYRPGRRVSVGVAAHIITGTNRLSLKRVFSDTLYTPAVQRTELSIAAFGVSLGVLAQLTNSLAVSALARSDGTASIDRDSTEVGRVNLPVTLGGGLRWHPARRLDLAGQVLWRNWSTASDQLMALGGTGANNTLELAGGLEFVTHARRPGHLPLRLGVRRATLPFPVTAGAEAKEFGISAGTGFSFAAERGTLSFAVERAWRSETAGFRERAWIVTAGVTIRP
jgi:hypothetical protein